MCKPYESNPEYQHICTVCEAEFDESKARCYIFGDYKFCSLCLANWDILIDMHNDGHDVDMELSFYD